MRAAILSYGLGLLSLLALGPAVWWLTSTIHDETGSRGTSLLLSAAPAMAVFKALIAIAVAAAAGLLSARFVSVKAGYWNAGVVLAWAAAGLGTIDQIVRARASAEGVLPRLAIELAIVAIPVCILAFFIDRTRSTPADEHQPEPLSKNLGLLAAAIAAAAVGAAIGAHLVMQSNLKGQAIGAAACGAILAAVGATLAWTRGPVWPIVAGTLIAGIAGPLIIAARAEPSSLIASIFGATVSGVARITPLDWAAGAMMGTPIGLWLATGLLERKQAATARAMGTQGT